MHRAYHLGRVPTISHKARVAADWAMALFFGREMVSLGQVQHPRREWEWAARGAEQPVDPSGTGHSWVR